MFNVLLAGQADHDNFGDSLIYAMYIKMLKESKVENKIYIWKASKIFQKRLMEDGIFDIIFINNYEDIYTYDINKIILVPGGYLGCPDITDIFWQFKWKKDSYIKTTLDIFSKIKINILIHGVEFGPNLRPFVLPYVKSFLNLDIIKNIYTRNNAGAKYIQPCVKSKVNVLPDFVMAVNKFYGEINVEKKYDLGIHATGKIFSKNIISHKFFINLIGAIADLKIKNILIFSDQPLSFEHKEKIKEFSSVLQSLGCNVEVQDYKGHISIISLINSCKNLITSKLHVGVVGLSYGIKVISISSHPKLIRFYSDIGLSDYSINYFFSLSSAKKELIKKVYNMSYYEYFRNINYTPDDVKSIYLSTVNEFLKF